MLVIIKFLRLLIVIINQHIFEFEIYKILVKL